MQAIQIELQESRNKHLTLFIKAPDTRQTVCCTRVAYQERLWEEASQHAKKGSQKREQHVKYDPDAACGRLEEGGGTGLQSAPLLPLGRAHAFLPGSLYSSCPPGNQRLHLWFRLSLEP